MRRRWLTCLVILGITTLLVLPALAQTTGSGAGSAPSSGTGSGIPGPTTPAPVPSTTQPNQPATQPGTPSVGTAPGTAIPRSAQPGTGLMGSGGASTDPKKSTVTNGLASSEQVKSAQQTLQSKGMDPGPVDGIMGPRTKAALRGYQKDQNLPQTGLLDDQTLAKLGVSK
jgi:hypothetical protein